MTNRPDFARIEESHRCLSRLSSEAFCTVEHEPPIPTGLPPRLQAETMLEHSTLVECNLAFAGLYGAETTQDLLGLSLAELTERPSNLLRMLENFVAEDHSLLDYESQEESFDGTRRSFLSKVVGVVKEGQLLGTRWIRCETTALRIAEDKLKRLEARLQDSHKLGVLGRLTAGLTHEFNNVLTVIHGNLELSCSGSSSKIEAEAFVRRAVDACFQARTLTRRLVDYSHHESGTESLVQMHDLVTEMEEIFRRALGLRVQIETTTGEALWICRLDAALLETAILNLAINARDAMRLNGKLRIETANRVIEREEAASAVEPRAGKYVMLAISDSGGGTPQEHLAEASGSGLSTGTSGKENSLGLSAVQEFVKQAGGFVEIESELSGGTTVRLYFPCCSDSEPESPEERAEKELPRGRGEQILVVDDTPPVRELAITFLHSLGYRTLEASSTAEAIEILDRTPKLDLLFTDMLFPRGINGMKLGQEARSRNPSIRVLHTSGFTEKSFLRGDQVERGFDLIEKPYSRAQLARRIRRALDKT